MADFAFKPYGVDPDHDAHVKTGFDHMAAKWEKEKHEGERMPIGTLHGSKEAVVNKMRKR